MAEVRALNYSAHAIEDLRRFSREHASIMPQLASCYGRIAACIYDAIKFILPNQGELIDVEQLSQAHYDLLQLPFPCVALEIPWLGDGDGIDERMGQKVSRTTKRIALCWNPSEYQGPMDRTETLLAAWPGGGVCVLPLYMTVDQPQWQVAHGVSFLPFGIGLTPNRSPDTAASHLAFETAQKEGKVSRRRTGSTMVVRILVDEIIPLLVQKYGSLEAIDASIMTENRDEAQILIQTCAVLNCANVETYNLPPSEKLNKARSAKGCTPFFSYKVLTLSPSESHGSHRMDNGGSHATPRQHLRRGHLRRLSDKTIWVRPTMVGHQGYVDKAYRVRP